jgi:hypothetical protein
MEDGLLTKLTIIPFEDSETIQMGPPAGPPFVVQFNPETFSFTNEMEYEPIQPPPGDDGSEAKFRNIKPRSFDFEFLLDGTGANGEKREVLAQIELFKLTVSFYGKIHRPRFLVLTWGRFIVTCVLEKFTITYKLFRPNGLPLRAVISATFREHKPKVLSELLANKSSPDIGHSRLVRGGEHLALITHRVYKDPRYYFHVAESNNLNNLRHIESGKTLYLPPII